MSLETIADELYGLLPSEFTAARDARAREARSGGDRDLARRISGLRKPTLAAWAANLLVREHPEETARFLALGEELRRAYQDLDGDQLRELARTQRRLTQALSRSARDTAATSGQAIGDAAQREVEQTLQAVLADPEAAGQWSAGRLTKPLTPPTGFSSSGLPATSPGRTPTRKSTRAAEVADLDQARDKRHRQRDKAEEARRAAEETAAEAAEEARRAEDERAAADDVLARAKERRRAADERLTAARDALRDAEREQKAAAGAEHEAHTRAQDASRTAHEARRRADRTTREATSLRPGARRR